jgi:hypothetical protein
MSVGWQPPKGGRVDDLFAAKVPTDKELEAILPSFTLEERIEAIIRKYVGGAYSVGFNGENTSDVAYRYIATYLLRKMRRHIPELAAGRRRATEPPSRTWPDTAFTAKDRALALILNDMRRTEADLRDPETNGNRADHETADIIKGFRMSFQQVIDGKQATEPPAPQEET